MRLYAFLGLLYVWTFFHASFGSFGRLPCGLLSLKHLSVSFSPAGNSPVSIQTNFRTTALSRHPLYILGKKVNKKNAIFSLIFLWKTVRLQCLYASLIKNVILSRLIVKLHIHPL